MKSTTLSEEYRRNLQAGKELIQNPTYKDNADPEYIRLFANASCYKVTIEELDHPKGIISKN